MLSETEIGRMLFKASAIERAIANDDRDALTKALEVDCMFCLRYKRIQTKIRVETETACDDCPLWKEKVCHTAQEVITDFRIVDRYWMHFYEKSNNEVQKGRALVSIQNIRRAIERYAVDGYEAVPEERGE